jgi:hypothetical protein
MRRKYPLEPLLRVRTQRVEQRAVEHGALARAGHQAQALARTAKGRREKEEQSSRGVQSSERQRLTAGGARASDLQQAERHRAGAVERVRALAKREADAATRARAADEAAEGARAKLAEARASERAVERHAGRFRAGVERTAERAEEEAFADQAAAMRRGARRG